MRIGLFTEAYFPIISGVSISVRTLKHELTKLGHTVYVITNDHEHAEPEDHVLRLGGYRLPMKGLREYRIGKVTRKKVREVGALNLDLIHCHTEFTMGRLGRRVARKYNLPVVHTYHTMYEDYVHFVSKTMALPLRFASRIFSRSFANSADLVVFPTIKVKRTFEKYGFTKPSHIVPTGIYLERFRKINYDRRDLTDIRHQLGLLPEDFVCLFLGRLSREKSIDDLIEYFAKIDEQQVKLVLVGGGPDKEAFAERAKKLKIAHRVKFTGMIDPIEVGKYYQIADLFVNFSVTETQGLTYIEALASGVPLLVKYDDNLEGVVENGYNGFTFRKNEEFVSLFERIFDNPILLSQLTSNANKAIQKYSASTYAKKMDELYLTLFPQEGEER